jgi:hypothetical protein
LAEPHTIIDEDTSTLRAGGGSGREMAREHGRVRFHRLYGFGKA